MPITTIRFIPDPIFKKEMGLCKLSKMVIETCTIITTEANSVLEQVHDRMPVILKEKDYDDWLDEKEDNTDYLQKLLVPYPASAMKSHPVSRLVNSPGENSPDLILNSQ